MYLPQVDEFYLIIELETRLRFLIERTLSDLSDAWWDKYIPDEVRRSAESYRNKISISRSSLTRTKYLDLLFCCGLREYREIITDDTNWEAVYKNIFSDNILFTRSRFELLVKIRNMIMHGNPIDEYSTKLLHEWIRLILDKMENWPKINEKYAKRSLNIINQGNVEQGIVILKDGLDNTITRRTPMGDPWLAYCLGNAYRRIGQYDYTKYWYQYAIDTLPVPEVRKRVITDLDDLESSLLHHGNAGLILSLFTVFILECNDGSFFTWYSNDVIDDYKRHQEGIKSEYTKRRRPLRIVYLEKCSTENEAKKRANVIRRMSRKQKMHLILHA